MDQRGAVRGRHRPVVRTAPARAARKRASTLAYQSYFYALLLQLDPGNAAGLALFLGAGTAIAAVVRFALVPERPPAVLRDRLRAFRADIAVLLHDLARSLAPTGGAAGRKRAGAHLSRLNDLSLDIESQLALLAPGRHAGEREPAADEALRDRVLHAGIAAETLATAAAAVARQDAPDRAATDAFRDHLLALREHVNGTAAIDHRPSPGGGEDVALPLDDALAWRFHRAIDVLAHEAPWDLPLPRLRDEHDVAPAAPAASTGPAGWRRWLALDGQRRAALQAGAAAAVAAVAGHAISGDHWYWAVFAAFIIFIRAESTGQALSRAWQRTLASVAGVAAGLALAELVQGKTDVEVALLFAFIAAGFYAFQAFQPVYMMLLTAMLAMLYGLLGRPTEGLLLVRLVETLAGAAIAVLAAALVVPLRTSSRAAETSAAVLREAAAVVRATFDPADRTAPRDAVRELDRRLQTLRRTLGPVTTPTYPAPKGPHRRRLQQLSQLVYCVRHLYHLNARHPHPDGNALAATAQVVADNIDAAAEALEGRPPGPLRDLPSPGGMSSDRQPASPRISRQWLSQVDGVVRELAADVQQVR